MFCHHPHLTCLLCKFIILLLFMQCKCKFSFVNLYGNLNTKQYRQLQNSWLRGDSMLDETMVRCFSKITYYSLLQTVA